jgi:hypothetical protein
MITYWEKLKDPRWQKTRLLKMEKADFSCERCGDAQSTLNIHHKEYFKGREPWEYNEQQLVCLCEDCHGYLHSREDFLKKVCSYLNVDGPNSRNEVAWFLSGLIGIPYAIALKWSDSEDCQYFQTIYENGKNYEG